MQWYVGANFNHNNNYAIFSPLDYILLMCFVLQAAGGGSAAKRTKVSTSAENGTHDVPTLAKDGKVQNHLQTI